MPLSGQFMMSGGEIYWVTDEDFARINIDDIRNHKYGWRRLEER
jgi:hypothetical protein